MSITKAKISSCDKKGGDEKEDFYVQFNPNEISINEYVGRYGVKKTKTPENKNSQNSQKSPSRTQIIPLDESKGITFSTKLFFNTYNSANSYSDVRPLISNFDKFLNKDVKTAKALKYIRFSWGSTQVFGKLTSMSVSYTMFSREGDPVRAEVSISITGDYVRVTPKSVPEKEQTNTDSEKFSGFADALTAYGSMDELKKASRAGGITNGRTQKK
jgi:hypothetical protein